MKYAHIVNRRLVSRFVFKDGIVAPMYKGLGAYLYKSYLRAKEPEVLMPFERRVYSQQGEDGVIEEIFKRIGTDSKYAVEFGVEDGSECCTRYLKDVKGWEVLQMDGSPDNPPSIKQEYVTPKNINKLFKKYNVPNNLDLLVVDIDSNDFWVWKAIDTEFKPRVIVAEYNAAIAPSESKSVAYDPDLVWDGTNYFGASLLALYRLAKTRGYDLIYCNENGVNAFFVRSDLVGDKLVARPPISVYRGPSFGVQDKFGAFMGHKPGNREFVTIDEDLNAKKS